MAVQADNKSTYHYPETVPAAIFRAYDIRGPVAEDALTENSAYALGCVLGERLLQTGQDTMVVARDGRLSGPMIADALIAGLRAVGCAVIFVGVVSSPVLYFARIHLQYPSAVMVTASHNPTHHNGFKIILDAQTLSGEGVQGLYQRLQKPAPTMAAQPGTLKTVCVLQAYWDTITAKLSVSRPLKVVVDAGNAVASEIAPVLYEAMGAEVVPLYCEVDGSFPNHHPDPLVPENLRDLQQRVLAENADCGLAFDGDADRIGVVTNTGEIIWPDRLMMWFAEQVLAKHPGVSIVYDVKCSAHLGAVIERAGGQAVMWKTGHSLIKNKAKACASPFSGELSGHLFFDDDWFGFDDGVYVGARLLAALSAQSQSLQEIFAAYPNSVNTPELKVAVPAERQASVMHALLAMPEQDGEQRRLTIDGLRIEFHDGWGLVRASNTTPALTCRFEAESQAAIVRLQSIFKAMLLQVDASLSVPFE